MNLPLLATKISALLRLAPLLLIPPANSTSPSPSAAARCPERDVVIRPAGLKRPVGESYTSAVSAPVPSLSPPPVIRTRPRRREPRRWWRPSVSREQKAAHGDSLRPRRQLHGSRQRSERARPSNEWPYGPSSPRSLTRLR